MGGDCDYLSRSRHFSQPKSEALGDPASASQKTHEAHKGLASCFEESSWDLRRLVDTFYDAQKLRIAVYNRLLPRCTLLRSKREDAKQRCELDRPCVECEHLDSSRNPLLQALGEHLLENEEVLGKEIKKRGKQLRIYQAWLRQVRGVGPILASAIVAYLGDVTRFPTVSKLWKYCGFSPDQASRERGKPLGHNPKVKTILWRVGNQLLIHRSQYSAFYYQRKRVELGKGLDKNRAHSRALRYMLKIFLAHLWEVSRLMAGLEAGKPYVIEKLGHKDYIPPIRERR